MTSKSSAFTGKHMAAVFIGGFGVVIAVNLVMASYAVGCFHGTVVDNSGLRQTMMFTLSPAPMM